MTSYLLELGLAQMMVMGLGIRYIIRITEDIMSRKLRTLQPRKFVSDIINLLICAKGYLAPPSSRLRYKDQFLIKKMI